MEEPRGQTPRRSLTLATSEPSPSSSTSPKEPASKVRKVSRACDFCKSRKAKCTGNRPCAQCVSKGRNCFYNARYTRGRPVTPPSSGISVPDWPVVRDDVVGTAPVGLATPRVALRGNDAMRQSLIPDATPSRASPELGMAEIQGQVFDPTSGMTFLHRAWKRLSAQQANDVPDMSKASADSQPMTMAGDRPLPKSDENVAVCLPSPDETRTLLALFFDVCIATYRFLYRPAVEQWLSVVESNIREKKPIWHEIGHARAAIVLVALAIATTHKEKSKGLNSEADEARALSLSDELFSVSSLLVETETGYPKLESAQARLVQVLYLMTTSRYNKGWFVFGTALQIISGLGLHRRETLKRRRTSRTDYIHVQCRRRSFWTAYILDNYLGVIFGRPRHFHDDDIDQDYPDRVNDEEITSLGPSGTLEEPDACHIDSLIWHAKIAQIIGSISRDVYTIKDISDDERVAAAHHLIQRIHEWKTALPLHLGAIRPSMLIPSYRRQATVIKLAHCHAVIHAGRLFLLRNSAWSSANVKDTIAAAHTVLETVDQMTSEGPIFHAFWWTHYVTFCALVVIYVWEIQRRRLDKPTNGQEHIGGDEASVSRLLRLAERCHMHLARATATNSPSRRYAVILDEFRNAASSHPGSRPDVEQPQVHSMEEYHASMPRQQVAITGEMPGPEAGMDWYQPVLLDTWQTTDWLDLHSSAFWTNVDYEDTMEWPWLG